VDTVVVSTSAVPTIQLASLLLATGMPPHAHQVSIIAGGAATSASAASLVTSSEGSTLPSVPAELLISSLPVAQAKTPLLLHCPRCTQAQNFIPSAASLLISAVTRPGLTACDCAAKHNQWICGGESASCSAPNAGHVCVRHHAFGGAGKPDAWRSSSSGRGQCIYAAIFGGGHG